MTKIVHPYQWVIVGFRGRVERWGQGGGRRGAREKTTRLLTLMDRVPYKHQIVKRRVDERTNGGCRRAAIKSIIGRDSDCFVF